MKRKHEQSIIDGFFRQFQKIADKKEKKLVRCSTDGQDSILGADYIFTNNSKFVLTEFKYEEKDLKSENKKPRRLKLCELLNNEEIRRKQSLECHYISWSKKTSTYTRELYFNQYYWEICNRKIFNGEKLHLIEPKYNKRFLADNLINKFFNHDIGAGYPTFKSYIDWLFQLENNSNSISELEILLDNPDSEQLEFLEFKSLDKLKEWMDETLYEGRNNDE